MVTNQKGMSVNSDNEKGPGMAVDDNGLKADEARLNSDMDDNQEVKVVRDGRVTTIARRGMTWAFIVVVTSPILLLGIKKKC